ncbi:MAG: hypothetical protein ABIB71_04230 [Candidatus Woesearchaeota archaeon]
MKIKSIIVILCLLLLASCSRQAPADDMPEVQQEQIEQAEAAVSPDLPEEQLCKAPYYEYMAGECCLDANANGICDRDESPAEDSNEKDVGKVAQSLTSEYCGITSMFQVVDCVSSYIYEDHIELSLRANKAGYTFIKKVEIVSAGCEATFDTAGKEMSEGLNWSETATINIDCVPKKESIDSDLLVTVEWWEMEVADDNNPVTPSVVTYANSPKTYTNKGYISGMVRKG